MMPSDGRALSLRAIIAGLVLTVLFAALAPINDSLLHNTYLYGQHLPVGVFMLLTVIGVVINPLLGKFRFRSNELMVVVSMLLVLGGVVAAGLNDYFPPIVAGPAKIMATSGELNTYVDRNGDVQLPKSAYIGLPENGAPDANDPEYKYVIDGYHSGLGGLHQTDRAIGHRTEVVWSGPDGTEHRQLAWAGGGGGEQTLDLDQGVGKLFYGARTGDVLQGADGPIQILSTTSPGIPWGVWADALLAWSPLLVSALVCFLCIAAMVRHQWIVNERLTYPIAQVISGFLQDPEAGSRFAPVFRQRGFWVAAIVVTIVLGSQGLMQLGYLPFSIPTKFSLIQSFNFPPFNQGYAPAWLYLKPAIYFSIVGLVFFLPSDMSLSVWLCFVVGNVLFAILKFQGVPLEPSMVQKISMGGWFVECLFILWIGRRYYASLLRTAFSKTDDPQLQEVRPFTWAFLASSLGMVVAMMAFGAYWYHAILAALCYLGAGLVLARLVAEAGIPFVQTPMMCGTVIFSLTGLTAPMAALVPLTLLGQTLAADGREHVLPFACNAEYLMSKTGVKRLHWGAIAALVLGVGTVISGAVMLWCAYAHNGQQSLDGWWKHGPLMGNLGPIATHAEGGDPINQGTTLACYGVGGVITGGLGIARMAWAWWPVSPIGMLVFACFPIYKIWFSFFVGWLLKVMVMRYGAVQLYNKLKPVAMGLIASEAAIAGLFLVIGLIAGLYGYRLPGNFLFMPD